MTPRIILVADDETDMELLVRQKFRKQITAGNYIFHFAYNGELAFQKLIQHPEIEMIMTDINMPVMNGLEFLKKIGEQGVKVKCIVASAYNDIQNIRTAMNSGAFDFITKPIDFNDLETTIHKTLRAVDEMKQAEIALLERDMAKKESEQAKASEKFKQQFLANMSHEIRTPMNSVIGITHLLLRSHLNEQQRRYISMVQAASEQLMSIINDILDISKIEAGKMVFENIDFSIEKVVHNVKNILSMKADEKQLEMKIDISKELPVKLKGDPSRLAQILTNLAGNSIKFTHEGFVEMKAVIKSKSSELYEIEFSVSDTGIGIPKDKIESIFESFTQAENDTSRKYGGTGLGLSISKQLVELQGGEIGLESKYGVGTRFYFTIPYQKADANSKSTIETPSQNNFAEVLTNARILLVEDNEFNKVVAEDTLTEYLKNITLEHAANGLEAVTMVTTNNYDLVLMDIQMPEMDGYEATVKIRSLEGGNSHVPIMAMTANATPEEISKCFESGMDEYISKPFVPEELIHKMAGLVSRKPQPK